MPVIGVDTHLSGVPAGDLTPPALRQRFRHPPVWKPEHSVEKKFSNREPALAAVLMPLVMRDELTLLLTERTSNLSTHSGQIAFPGGKTDDTDADAVDTALREAQEEIGLTRDHVEVLGTLPIYTTGTAFIITPVVALVQPGFALQPNPGEVADVFEVPLALPDEPGQPPAPCSSSSTACVAPVVLHALHRGRQDSRSASSGAPPPACCATSTASCSA